MCTPLPKISDHSWKPFAKAPQPRSRQGSLKLPPWDKPAQIHWEPLEPPSPYQPIIQKRNYPSVLSGFSRLVVQRSDEVREDSHSINNIVDENMTYEDEEVLKATIIRTESQGRDSIVFSEQHEWTRLWLEFLHDVNIFLEEDIQLAEIVAREACEREEERERVCRLIEMKASAQCIKKRMQENIMKKSARVMPLYKEGRDLIIKEEAEEIGSLVEWFRKNRPFGMRLPAFISGERQRYLLPGGQAGQKNVTSMRLRRKMYSTRGVASSIITDTDTWPGEFPESSYQEEGRQAWRKAKLLRYTQRKTFLYTHEVEEKEEADRGDILAEEAKEWLPIISLEVDGRHEANLRAQDREKAEAKAENVRLEEAQKREAIFKRLETVASVEKNERGEDEERKEETEGKEKDSVNENCEGHHETTSCAVDYDIVIKKERQILNLLRTRIKVLLDLENIDEIKSEAAAMEVLRRRERLLQNLGEDTNMNDNNDDDDTDVIKEGPLCMLQRRQEVLSELEDIATMEKGLQEMWRHDNYQTTSSEEYEVTADVTNEKYLLLLLQRRESLLNQLEHIDSSRSEGSALQALRSYENMLLRLDVDNCTKAEVPSTLSTSDQTPTSDTVCGRSSGTTKMGSNQSEEKSSSWGSDSGAAPLHPMLNMVLSVAIERDPFVGLRNPAISALAEAECALAACEGRRAGSAARALAFARHIPFCPAYLVHTIWRPLKTQEDVQCESHSANISESAVLQLLKLEEEEREQLIKEQIVAVWDLYQRAAEDAGDVSKTAYGKEYYIGVRMGSGV